MLWPLEKSGEIQIIPKKINVQQQLSMSCNSQLLIFDILSNGRKGKALIYKIVISGIFLLLNFVLSLFFFKFSEGFKPLLCFLINRFN